MRASIRDHLRLGASLVLAAAVVGGALWGLATSLKDSSSPRATPGNASTNPPASAASSALPPNAEGRPPSLESPRGVVFTCEKDGHQTFTDVPCGPGTRQVRQARMKDGSAGVGGGVYAEQLARMAPAVPVGPAVPLPPPAAAVPAPRPTADAGRCKALYEWVRRIDAAARMPLPPQEQDRLSADRKRANDEIFTLRCESLERS